MLNVKIKLLIESICRDRVLFYFIILVKNYSCEFDTKRDVCNHKYSALIIKQRLKIMHCKTEALFFFILIMLAPLNNHDSIQIEKVMIKKPI